MNLSEKMYQLPAQIRYEGYLFNLEIRHDQFNNLYLGYYLLFCESKKKYKKRAFQLGIWSEKDKVPVSSVESNYLFKALILDDLELAIEILKNQLKINRLPLRYDDEIEAIDTEFQEIHNYSLSI